MPFHTDLMYAYNLTNKVIKTLEKLEKKHNPYRNKTVKRGGKKRKNKTRKN
tara:strand:- start:435 stop:587 length:153 start_codon:yes stop_codon:yes gene_type:complete